MADAEPPIGDVLVRPAGADIKRAWTSLFSNPLLSTASLKRAALDGLPDADELSLAEVENWMPLRSLHWKLSLSILPSPAPQLFQTPLRTSRQSYDDLRFAYLRSPDGGYPADISVPPSRSGSGRRDPSSQAAASSGPASNGVFDPLSLEDESPWKKYYKDLEVKKEIRKDVERTFPDVPYFKTDHARVMLTTILFLHCTLHPDVSYRQGMHELAAAMLLAVELDSLPVPADGATLSTADAVLHETLSRAHVEHDAYTLFSALMRNGAQAFYAHHPESDAPRVSRAPSAPEAKQPIIKVCDSMWELLGRIDPALKAKLDSEGIEPQLFGIRWVRLLFTREFPLPVAMSIWDALLALDPSLGLSTQLCIALLLRIRNILLAGDYSDSLTSLLRYPGHSQEYPLDPLLLIQQALDIKEAPTPTTGVHLIMQNADLLGIPAQAPEIHPPEDLNQRGPSRRGPPRPQLPAQHAQQRSLGLPASFNINLGAAVAAAQSSGLGELAKGLAIKGREMGEKALREQVSQMRRNLPDFPTSPVGSGFLSPRPAGLAGFPPSPSSPSSSSLEAEVASLKAKMWTLGAALDRCLTTLDTVQAALPQLPATPSGEPGLDEKMARALVGVQIVRDALGDPERPFDQGLLREILASTAGGSVDDLFIEGETEPTSPVFTPIVSPSPVHQSPYIPPQPPSPSASPPPELPPPTTSVLHFGGLTGRTVSGGEGVALPSMAHSFHRPSSSAAPPLPPPPPPPPPPPLPMPPSYSPLTTPILNLPTPPARVPVGLTGSPPSPQPQSLAARLAQAAQKPATRPSSTVPAAAKPPPWVRAGDESAARSSSSYPPAPPPPPPPPPPRTIGDPLAGAPSTTRSEHWRSASSSKRSGGPTAGLLNGGDPLGAL